jgi:hypothetical protein
MTSQQFSLVISISWGISKHTDDSGETTCREWTPQDFLWQQIIINSRRGTMLGNQTEAVASTFRLGMGPRSPVLV